MYVTRLRARRDTTPLLRLPPHGPASHARHALTLLMVIVPALATHLRAQSTRTPVADTVSCRLADLEQRFLNDNLALLAARFQVDAARAAVEQARLWNNPTLSISQTPYNPQTRRLFDATGSGNPEIQLSQLILLAGKRRHQVAVADANASQAGASLNDLLRSLRLELRSDFWDLYVLQRAVAIEDRQLVLVGQAVAAAERLYAARSILLADVVRLRALRLSVQSERLGFEQQIADLQGSLRLLLRDEGRPLHWYAPRPDSESLAALRLDTLAVEQLLQRALERRPDLRVANEAVRGEASNLALQRATAVPDVTVGGSFSRNGSYFPDYFGLFVSMDLPLLNRNQGNIHVSERTLDANRTVARQARLRVERETIAAWQKAVAADRAWRGLDGQLLAEYATLVGGTLAQYERRDLSLLQLTDFLDTYRQVQLQVNQLLGTRLDAIEALNFAAGAVVVAP